MAKIQIPPILRIPLLLIPLFLAIYVEFELIIGHRGTLGPYWSPLLLFVAGVFIGLWPILLKVFFPEKLLPSLNPQRTAYDRWIIWGIFVVGIVFLVPILTKLFQQNPTDYKISDVIPQVQLFSKRLLGRADGLGPYAPHTHFGYKMDPTYLPFQWLPFVIPELLGFEYRWMPFSILMIGIGLMFILLNKSSYSTFWKVIIAVSPFMILYQMAQVHPYHNTRIMLVHTIEIMDVGYYLILAFAVIQGSKWLIASGLLLTILSRYSFLFWIPAYWLTTFFKENKKKALQIAGSVALGVTLIYVIPFWSQDWTIFSRGQAHYERATVADWTVREGKEVPHTLFQGLGMGIFFYEKASKEELARQINTLKMVQIGSIILISMALFGLYFKVQNRIRLEAFFLLGLKVYLAFFYAFVQIPFAYLYLLPLFFSLVVIILMGLDLDPKDDDI